MWVVAAIRCDIILQGNSHLLLIPCLKKAIHSSYQLKINNYVWLHWFVVKWIVHNLVETDTN